MALSKTQVSQLYVSIFGRASEGSGNTYWQADASSMTDAANKMLATSAAATYFGTSLDDNAAFIKHIYLNTLGKTYAQDTGGVDYWVGELAAGKSRGEVVAALIEAAQLPVNAGAAQDMFKNKVAVSDYTADNIATANVADLSAFTGYISNVTSDAATVTAAKASVDTTAAANTPKTYTLTTGSADVVESGGGNDTITGTTSTLQSGDMIIDSSTTDKDTFNLTLTAANATQPTVKNIENVNVELNYFTGTATDLDMTNYSGSTVTLGSSKLGFNGISGAVAVGGNTVKAGANVNTFTVTGLTTGTVDAGSAKTVSVTGLAGVANTIVVNGDITTGTGLVNTTSTKTTLNITAAATVLYNPGAATIATTVTGDHDVTLKMAVADIITGTSIKDSTSGIITLSAVGGTFDSTNFEVDKILLDNTATNAATVASGQVLETTADIGTKLTILTTSALDTTATLNLGHDLTELDVKDDKLVTTINNTDNNIISTLTATGEKVIVKGASNLVVGNANAKTFDASAATGELTYSLVNTGTTQTISGTTGKNTVTLGNVADVVSFTGQSGVDTIKVDALALTGTVAGDLGAGNDVVTFDDLGAGATVALQGGAGTDVIKITDGGDLSAMGATGTWAVSGFETIELQGAVDSAVTATTTTWYGSQLNGATYNVTTKEAIDTVAMTVTLNGATTDLSKVTFQAGDTVAINGSATTSYTVVGTNVADTITLGSNAAGKVSTVTGGAGDDVFVVATSNTSAAQMLKITDYQANASSSDNDKLSLGVTTVTGDKTVSVKALAEDGAYISTAAAAIFADATNAVNVVVKDGMMTLSGLSADVALADTLAEMITLAQFAAVNTDSSVAGAADVVGFVFQGNTYVIQTAAETIIEAGGTGTVADTSVTLGTVTNVVELVGLTDAVAIAGAAAAHTIFVA